MTVDWRFQTVLKNLHRGLPFHVVHVAVEDLGYAAKAKMEHGALERLGALVKASPWGLQS